MENIAEVENVIKEAVTACADEKGWANLAEIGAHLRVKGVKYGKLSKFLEKYQSVIEIKSDKNINPPISYAKLK